MISYVIGKFILQVDMLRDRSRNYLIMHLILGGTIFGISLAILGIQNNNPLRIDSNYNSINIHKLLKNIELF